LILELEKEVGQVPSKEWYNSVFASGELGQEPVLESCMVRLGGVEITANAIATIEGGGGLVSSNKCVSFVDFGIVQENREAFGVEESDDLRV
jgi:hypothetical protein